ncbi:hypothetical protein V1477_002155 [Vespula maculifrons]|uniref:Uncharacterized protein n=1 Tax=Vespula maculifrons TaxID=7453 RepID=A0ABD2CX62_VESMC
MMLDLLIRIDFLNDKEIYIKDGNILISKINVKKIVRKTDKIVLTHVKYSKHEQFIKNIMDSYNSSNVREVGIQMDLISRNIQPI